MILEVAPLQIIPGQAAAFEQAFEQAQRIISTLPGYAGHQLQRSLTDPHRYLLLVKHLGRAASDPGRFEMLLATPQGDYLIARPLYPFARQPVGVGDLISALMLANLQAGFDAVAAFERTNAAVDEVLRQTWQADAYELQLIAAQAAFAEPQIAHRAERLADGVV